MSTRDGDRSRARRDELFDQLQGVADLVGIQTDVGLIALPTWDRKLSRSLFLRRTRGDVTNLGRVMRVLDGLGLGEGARTGAFIDVGANLGTTTLAALRLHGFPEAVAIEPAPENCRLLRGNLALNGVAARATVVEAAVSDRVGREPLVVSRASAGSHRLACSGDDPRRTVDVNVVTLDSLMQRKGIGVQNGGIVWIDAHGQEGQVLAGARALLSGGVPLVADFKPDALRRVGGLEAYLGVVGACYTHVMDLAGGGGAQDLSLQPVATVGALAETYVSGRTDLLFVHL